MTDYYRPIPCETGRWQLAGGWVRFSQFELLARGLPPRVVDRAPDAVLTALTAPRPAGIGAAGGAGGVGRAGGCGVTW